MTNGHFQLVRMEESKRHAWVNDVKVQLKEQWQSYLLFGEINSFYAARVIRLGE